MRLASGVALIARGAVLLQICLPIEPLVLHILALHALEVDTGTLLLLGLWTRGAGSRPAVLELWSTFSEPGDPWERILFGSLGAALSLLGPGAWSLDSHLFGWKRIHLRAHED
jgi:hypothetical protein